MKTDLREYFDFRAEPYESIRLKGTRIGIEHVVAAFNDGASPEQLQTYFVRSLSLEEAYAAVAFYVLNREEVDAYIDRVEAEGERLRKEYEAEHPEAVERTNRLRRLKEQFTGPDGRVNLTALKAHVEQERRAKEAVALVEAG